MFGQWKSGFPRTIRCESCGHIVDVRTMDADLAVVYANTGRESIPPERWLRASLLQVLYSVHSERQLVEQIEFNLLYRWFVACLSGWHRLFSDAQSEVCLTSPKHFRNSKRFFPMRWLAPVTWSVPAGRKVSNARRVVFVVIRGD